MGDKTGIEWTDATWSPIIGCDRVSAGCDHCYAIGTAHIRASNPNPKVAAAFAGVTDRADGRVDWTGKVNLLPERLDQPLRWKKPRRIFVNSMSDLFHKDVPDEFIARVFAVMALAPQHTFQVLTKRPGRMRSLLSNPWWRDTLLPEMIDQTATHDYSATYPLPNVWLGVSVEDEKRMFRVRTLRETPAAVRFLSCEPLLGAITTLHRHLPNGFGEGARWNPTNSRIRGLDTIDWVIVGGESGAQCRPLNLDWVRTLRDQCVTSGVSFFFKQIGGVRPKSNGRLLDGQEWLQYPTKDHATFGECVRAANVGIDRAALAKGRA